MAGREQAQPSARRKGYSPAWERARKAFLAAHPNCIVPGCKTPATHVDHLKPHKGDQRLFWDRTNWRPMCKPHHSAKTATVDGGFGRPVRDPGEWAARGCDADGAPIDKRHPWSARRGDPRQ